MIIRAISLALLLRLANGFTLPPQNRPFAINTQRHAKNTNNSKQNKGFQQCGEINPAYCNLSKEEILDLIRDRNKARRSRYFSKADEILANLNRNNVHLNDSTKMWRADGDVFDIKGYSEMEYTKSSNSKPISLREEEYVNQKLNERSEAKLRRDFNTADDIIDELRFLKNVVVDDSALTWKVAESFKTEYTYGGRRLNNVPEEEISKIGRLIKERASAKEMKNYDKADEILEELQVVCGVRVDDAKKDWYFLPKIQDEMDRVGDDERNRWDQRDDRMVINNQRRNQNETQPNTQNNVRDWSVVDDEVPDDISISDAEVPVPDGISVSSDDAPAMPDGISIAIPEGISIASDDSDEMIPEGISINSKPASSKLSPSESELADCTVPMLKEKLREAGLPVSGLKAELIDRLLEAD